MLLLYLALWLWIAQTRSTYQITEAGSEGFMFEAAPAAISCPNIRLIISGLREAKIS